MVIIYRNADHETTLQDLSCFPLSLSLLSLTVNAFSLEKNDSLGSPECLLQGRVTASHRDNRLPKDFVPGGEGMGGWGEGRAQ